MAFECAHLLAMTNIPQSQKAIARTTQGELPGPTDKHGSYEATMAWEAAERSASTQVYQVEI
jgi:hypothetical protein